MGLFIVGVLSFVAGAVLVIVFSKNNKNHIEAARNEIVDAYNKGEAELKKLIDSWKK